MYELSPGYYEVSLMEGCNIPSNCALLFKTRSSLVRSGVIVHSGLFDAGFRTKKMGCFIQVCETVRIEKGSRIAQAIVLESNEVDKLYNGRYQNK